MAVVKVTEDQWRASFAAGGSLQEVGARVGASAPAAWKAAKRFEIEHASRRSGPANVVWNFGPGGKRKAPVGAMQKPKRSVPRVRVSSADRDAIAAATPPVDQRVAVTVRPHGSCSSIIGERRVTLMRAPWADNAAW